MVVYLPQEIRDAVLNSGMKRGFAESCGKFAEYLGLLAGRNKREG